jgi:hypothetical protein
VHDSLPPRIKGNTLICSYSDEYKDLWFKLYTFFNSYIDKLKGVLTNSQWRSKSNSVPITSDRRLVTVYEPEPKIIKGSKLPPIHEKKVLDTRWEKIKEDEIKNTYFNSILIKHKIPYVISEDEMKQSLLKASEKIEPTFKLKIKLLSKQINGFNINIYQ